MKVSIDLIDILGLETVIAACDYAWEKMEEYRAGSAEFSLWIDRWYTLQTELERAGYDWQSPTTREFVLPGKLNWLNPNSREIRARQGEDK